MDNTSEHDSPSAGALKNPLDYTWAHGVNSQDKLDAALRAASSPAAVNAVEADIIYSQVQQRPVMGHPPQKDGSLTLESFLEQLRRASFQTHASKTIVKLDFKSSSAFENGIESVRNYLDHTDFPRGLWLNADIVKGPSGGDPQFSAPDFLKLAQGLPDTVLSVGWTTGGPDCDGPYTQAMVDELLHELKAAPGAEVTFPIRATSFRNSWPVLKPLYEIPNYGVTLWWSQTEMSRDDLLWIHSTLEKPGSLYEGRTYYDIHGFEAFLANAHS
jgi:hypothetical protein